MDTAFHTGQALAHPIFGLGMYLGENSEYVSMMYGKETKKLSKKFPVILPAAERLKLASDEDQKKASLQAFFDTYTHSEQLKTYLQWLREAGPAGVVNDCGCAKDEFYNYTCRCRSLLKLYHRFSVFKDELSKRGYVIEDVEMENGKHKTILHSEPFRMFNMGGQDKIC